ncbi:MAG: PAS domain S-box protein [Janthinobacterium lividum]
MAGLIRNHDWTRTLLGAPVSWPQSLKTLVDVMLRGNQATHIVWGPEQTLLYNDSYAQILGVKHPAALGRPFLDVWSEIAADIRPLVDRAYAGSPVFLDDMKLVMERKGTPEETYFSFAYTPIRREGGAVDGFYCPCIETTRQVLNGQLTAHSEARHRQILDSAIDYAIVATDRDGLVTRWNSGAERTLDWTEAEMLGQSVDRFFTPEDQAAARPAVEMELARRNGMAPDERWHQRKSGERFWAMGEMTPLKDDAGVIVGFVKVLRDRTKERLADEALRQSQTELAAANARLENSVAASTAERDRLWETSLDLLLVLDFDGVIQSVNPAWTELLGYAPDELIGHAVADFVLPEDATATAKAVIQGRDQAITAMENRYRHKDRSTRWFSWVARPAAGEIYATGRHITDIKAAEATHRRTEDQLRQSQKVEAIGQLTGGVAHDFNNLLTVIRGSVDLLRRPGVSDERRQRYIDAISDTTDRAAKLTGQLLAFARRQSLTPEVFDAAASVRTVSDMVRTLTGSRIRLGLRLRSAPCYIDADRGQFDTAIVNMAVNARDAMAGEGELTITVGTVSGMPEIRSHPFTPGEFVTIALTDTGAGISDDQIDQIFQPFFTTKGIGEGTGLGLSQVFGFTKQSGGDVFVESVKGAGATFTMYLPRVESEAGTSAEAGDTSLTLGEGSCVLVVEDNAEVGIFATQALAELGYNTVLAMDGAKALSELATCGDRIDVVFSDVMMPGMSGVELGQEITRLYPSLPVILTSGYSEILAQNGTHGFELLHKPYSIDALSRALRKVSRRR